MCIISVFWMAWVSPFSLLTCRVLNFLFLSSHRVSEDCSPKAVIVEWNWKFLSVEVNVVIYLACAYRLSGHTAKIL